ncbi:MAG: DUF3500 domain-containing protein [Caldilineaceae bacterium]
MKTKLVVMNSLLALTLLAGCAGLGMLNGGGPSEASSNAQTINLADVTPAAVSEPVTATAADETTQGVVAAAEALLATLDEAQRAKALFAFDDAKQRANWSNFPTGIYQRSGLRMGDLSQEQRAAVFAVLEATLSPEGYQRVLDQVTGDEVLKSTDGGGNLIFGQDEFYFSILGTPSATDPWMWQFGGHHLALNATVVGGTITLAPSLTGGQPIQYTSDGRAVYQWQEENDAAFALINALDAEQQKQAILGNSYIQLVLGPGEDGKTIAPEGIKVSDLNADQQKLLLDLIRVRVGMLKEDDATAKMAEIAANLNETWFAWYGPTTNGQPAYYRIQGPTLFIEYSPQSMGGSAIDHIHAMFRDPTNDYGAALIK